MEAKGRHFQYCKPAGMDGLCRPRLGDFAPNPTKKSRDAKRAGQAWGGRGMVRRDVATSRGAPEGRERRALKRRFSHGWENRQRSRRTVPRPPQAQHRLRPAKPPSEAVQRNLPRVLPRQHDTMPRMPLEKLQPFDNPKIEPGRHMPRNLAHHMYAILEPLQLRARGRRPHRVFALFTVVTVLHPRSVREK